MLTQLGLLDIPYIYLIPNDWIGSNLLVQNNSLQEFGLHNLDKYRWTACFPFSALCCDPCMYVHIPIPPWYTRGVAVYYIESRDVKIDQLA